VFELLDPGRIGVTLTESMEMVPSRPPRRSSSTIPRRNISRSERRPAIRKYICTNCGYVYDPAVGIR